MKKFQEKQAFGESSYLIGHGSFYLFVNFFLCIPFFIFIFEIQKTHRAHLQTIDLNFNLRY